MKPVNHFGAAASNSPPKEQSGAIGNKVSSFTSVKDVHHCPYKDCSFSSTWKASLNNHIKTHTDERPWQCALCNKHFRLKHHLKHHILTHSSNKPFKCNLCEYRSNDVQSLQRHKVNKHKFPVKRKVISKALSLPTMVSMSSHDGEPSTSQFFSSMLSPHARNPNVPSDPVSCIGSSAPSSTPAPPSLPSNSLSSISEALMQRQRNLLSMSSERATKRSASDSSNVLIDRSLIGPDSSDTSAVTDDRESNGQPSILSVESIPYNLKDSPKHPINFKSLWNAPKPNSPNSSDCRDDGQTSVDSLTTKSPIASQSKFENCADDTMFDPADKSHLQIGDHAASSLTAKIKNSFSSLNDEDSTWKCFHCSIVFPDNIMFGLHMGCHSVGNPFQCNICGKKCSDRHDFMFHFTIGRHVY